MCEPTHSIVQYPNDDPESGIPVETRLGKFGQTIGEWLSKIGGWLHLSKLGRGHYEGIVKSGIQDRILPLDTKYEGLWWKRKVVLDGIFHGPKTDKQEALESATIYAHRVCMGDLRTLRRFLETSLKCTDRSYAYFDLFSQMLNEKGRDQYGNCLKQILHSPFASITSFNTRNPIIQSRITKLILGLTRKRELLIPEWADDTKLWVPTSPSIVEIEAIS